MEPKLVDNRSNKEIVIKDFPFTIGRTGCSWNIPTEGVAPKHLVIFSEEGKFFVEDRESETGTYLDNRLLEKKTQIRDGQSLKIAVTEKWPAGIKDLTFLCFDDSQADDLSIEDLDILNEDESTETDEKLEARHCIYHVSTRGFLKKISNRHRVPLERFTKDRIQFQSLMKYNPGDKILMEASHPSFEPDIIKVELTVKHLFPVENREYQIIEAMITKIDQHSNQLIFNRIQLN